MDDYSIHLVEEVRAERISRRELVRRGSIYGLSMSAIGSLLAACGSSKTSVDVSTKAGTTTKAFRKGGTARAAAVTPSGELEPITVNDAGTQFTMSMCCEYLAFPRADLSLVPQLATSWKPGSTVKEWTFKLRDNVMFQNGSKMTADDVVTSFNTYSNPKGTASALSSFIGILTAGNIEKIDDLTVRFHLDRPYADFPYLVSAFNYATAILPKTYKQGDFAKGGVGTGAYILKKYTQQRTSTFVANQHYWGPKPHLDGVLITYYAQSTGMVLAMEAGDLDLISGPSYQDAKNLFGHKGVTVYEVPGSSYRPVHMRVDQAPLSDKRVRQAVAYATDREQLVKVLEGGAAQLGNDHAFAPIFPTSPSTSEVPQRQLDVAKAKQLLAAAGHPNGLKLTLTTLQYEEIPQFAVLLKQQLAAANIHLSLDIETSTAYFGSGKNQPWLTVPMGIVYWADRGSPSQLIEPAYISSGVWNSAHFKNPQFDHLMADFDAQMDMSKRKQIAVQAARLMQDETPAMIGFWLKELRAVANGLQGVAPGPNVVFDPSTMGFAA
jgi:peptide/nickel transport system substrate-binding protein